MEKAEDSSGNRNPLIYLFRKEWQHSEGNRWSIVGYWTLYIVANLIDMILYPYLVATLIDIVQKQGITQGNIMYIYWLLSGRVLILAAFWSLHGPGRVMECKNGYLAGANYQKRLIRGVLGLHLDWHAERLSGDIIDKIKEGSDSLYEFCCNSFVIIMYTVRLLVSLGMLTYYSRTAGIVVTVALCIAVVLIIQFDKSIVKSQSEISTVNNDIAANITNYIGNITTVITLRLEKLVFGTLSKKLYGHYGVFMENRRVTEWKWFSVDFCSAIMWAVAAGFFFQEKLNAGQTVLLSSVYLLIKYLDELDSIFRTITSVYGNIIVQKVRVANSEKLAHDFRKVALTNHVLPSNWKTITVENLNFSYVNAEGRRIHLDNVNISFRRGQKIAFVGESGSGKSTMFKVMQNLHPPQSLRLYSDVAAIPEGFSGICNAITLVPQEPELFATTIRENLTFGADIPDETINRYNDMACFTDIVERLPKKLDSIVNEKGVKLSVGQKQRLGLSRGLLAGHGRDILVLDEPTSSLDAKTEETIYKNIFAANPGTTIFSSLHRLYLLPLFDYIYMFEEGKIIASGTLGELLETCPKFYDLYHRKFELKQN